MLQVSERTDGPVAGAGKHLDRLLHEAETVVIEGKSYRMKDRVEDPPV